MVIPIKKSVLMPDCLIIFFLIAPSPGNEYPNRFSWRRKNMRGRWDEKNLTIGQYSVTPWRSAATFFGWYCAKLLGTTRNSTLLVFLAMTVRFTFQFFEYFWRFMFLTAGNYQILRCIDQSIGRAILLSFFCVSKTAFELNSVLF